VKELNRRVKGTEKFWNDGVSGEAILQVRAAALCDDDRLQRHLTNRPGNPFRPNVRKHSLAAASTAQKSPFLHPNLNAPKRTLLGAPGSFMVSESRNPPRNPPEFSFHLFQNAVIDILRSQILCGVRPLLIRYFQ